jgi:hypothetical protein
MSKHRIVVSAENNPYMEWQCKLFYFSCITRLKQRPLIIVHNSEANLCSGFYELVKAGCEIYTAPNYRLNAHGDDYSGRNHPGSLIEAAKHLTAQDGFIVLCDPDLIFTRALEFPEALSGEFSSFMDYDSAHVRQAVKELSLEKARVDLQKESLRCSVPYVVPIAGAQQLGVTWLQAIDAFRPRRWEDVMYAFGLALVKSGLELNITHLTETNFWPDKKVTAPIVHYAYGDEQWTKRNYHTAEQAAAIWEAPIEAEPETILGEILTQIKQAGAFYRDPFALKSSV